MDEQRGTLFLDLTQLVAFGRQKSSASFGNAATRAFSQRGTVPWPRRKTGSYKAHYLGNPGRAGGGGVIRNANGDWVSGYARAIGNITSVAAKLWALRDGIDLCLVVNLPAVETELDAKLMADLLKKEGVNLNGNDVIVADCREGLKKIPLVRI
uniref:RNase H type-1 domain-containing protein n=1 Tax=Quercus lobata TaxID=97700 RepID=A0A7N2LCZ6_QUELO